jgi:hypothetical protein
MRVASQYGDFPPKLVFHSSGFHNFAPDHPRAVKFIFKNMHFEICLSGKLRGGEKAGIKK